MANNFEIGTTSSDAKVAVKAFNLKYAAKIYLKGTTDILRPRIILSSENDLKDCNYFYLDDFKRYYFITKIECEQQRYIIEGKVDALSSWYRRIRNQTVIVKRAQNKELVNYYLNDPKFTLLNMDRIQLKSFDNGFLYQGEKVKNFILTINGSGSPSTPSNGGDA